MDNKKIPTSLGTIILAIIALTAGLFVVKYEKMQKMEDGQVKKIIASKEMIEANQSTKQKDIYDETIHYTSQKLGVEFDYNKYRTGKIDSFIQENGNKIRLMVARDDGGYTKEKCQRDKECQEINGLRYWPGIGGLNIYEKNANKSIEDAITKLMKKNGGDPSKCVVDSYVNKKNGQKVYYIKQKKEYIPLVSDDILKVREGYKKFEIESQKICSSFSVGVGPGGKAFLYHPDESKIKFAFIFGEMLDAPDINENSVKFIEK